MNNLVVGVDFSEADQELLEVAIGLGKPLAATLHLVHVQRELAQWTEYSMIGIKHGTAERKRLTEMNQERLDELAARARDAGVEVDTSILEGEPVEQLLRFVDEKQGDLVVVGSHGRNRLERAVLGHVADRMARKSPLPVMIVPMAKEG